jgi:hypothetical protein
MPKGYIMLSHDGGDRWTVTSTHGELATAELWTIGNDNVATKVWYLDTAGVTAHFQISLALANANAWVVTEDEGEGVIAHIVNGELVRKWVVTEDRPDLNGVRLEVAASAMVLFHASFCEGAGCRCGI